MKLSEAREATLHEREANESRYLFTPRCHGEIVSSPRSIEIPFVRPEQRRTHENMSRGGTVELREQKFEI